MAEENKPQDKPKIVTDEDWKQQAQAEKEKLAEEVEQASKKAAAGAASPGRAAAASGQGPMGDQELPPASLLTLINQIAMQALMTLGGMEDPQTKKRYVDLELAKFHIDTLAVLDEKTRGNRNDEEDQLLEKALYDLRMSYVQIAQNAKRLSPEELEEMRKQAEDAGQGEQPT